MKNFLWQLVVIILTKEIMEEIGEVVEQYPLNEQAVLMPVLPIATKKKELKKEKAKHVLTDYDYVELAISTTNDREESPQMVVVKPTKAISAKKESISWARKQIEKAKTFFSHIIYQVRIA